MLTPPGFAPYLQDICSLPDIQPRRELFSVVTHQRPHPYAAKTHVTLPHTRASPQDICALPDEHPLKELFFAAFDEAMFRDLLARFVEQVG